MLLLVRLSRFWGGLEMGVFAAGRVGLADLVVLVGVLVGFASFAGAIVAVVWGAEDAWMNALEVGPVSSSSCGGSLVQRD